MKRLLMATFSVFYMQALLASQAALCAQPCNIAYCLPWSALLYYGKMTNDNLGDVIACTFSLNNDTLYSFEIGKELAPCNPIRLFFQPVVSSVDLRGNLTLLDDHYGSIYEINPYFALNWQLFRDSSPLKITLSFGEGFSYLNKVPYAEEKNSERSNKLLNFLLGEIAFALPYRPEWELIARIHHRSGAYGLYHANNAGSTAVGIAIRYRFG